MCSRSRPSVLAIAHIVLTTLIIHLRYDREVQHLVDALFGQCDMSKRIVSFKLVHDTLFGM
jgi:hypothetical protein